MACWKSAFSTSILLIVIINLILSYHGCSGISCFTCSSRNGSDGNCEDPFNATVATYTERCKVPKRDRTGVFPASFCVKMIGVSYKTNEKLTVRRCVLENMDTQCGEFLLQHDEERFKGCILTCAVDGCNSSNSQHSLTKYILLIPLFTFLACVSMPSIELGYLISQNIVRRTLKQPSSPAEISHDRFHDNSYSAKHWLSSEAG